MSSITASALREETRKRMAKVKAAKGESEAPAAPPPSLFNDKEQATVQGKNQKPYSEIVGEKHPSGKEYYFTVYERDDWEKELQALIPEKMEGFVPDHEYMLNILMSIEFNKTCFAYGAPGTGKTTCPEQVCAAINYPFMFISGMGGTEPSDYVGMPWVKDGSMSWKDAAASYAVRKGVFLLYDEPFKSSAQTNMCFQSLLDDRKTLKLYGHPDPIEGTLKAHPKFRIGLADNVRGFGDDMDKYAAEIQDQSTLNRCQYKVHVPYPSAKVEAGMLKGKFPSVTDVLADKVVSLAGMIRQGWEKGDISAPYSIRDTQELVEAALFHQDVGVAFKQTYYGAIGDPQESKAVADIFKTVFGSSAKLV